MAERRPNRSDVHLSEKEEMRIEDETRGYFDGLAPKRHSKPQRSEYSSQYADTIGNTSDVIPEFVKFQQLENDPQKLVYKGNDATEEYVETEYYKDLNCVDKQHHTTGTGFIGTENINGGSCFKIAPDTTCSACHSSSRGNPATNDWIPATGDKVTVRSDKPTRSDT
ncbi:uncharacterized protein LOC122085946 [Macadamia integrifolia]|uniref:uncharacterized protein LOC122085946 n=1 Tax=Macadamia integrifolia TaxID=60698 RepID=UPI001C4E8EF2|nr:uncharacterized protein LOC122085946 [Macadamia integrifolia]XP_042510507.1 uncharacterized protein LOC122085946 [Macadamia integrifolia]